MIQSQTCEPNLSELKIQSLTGKGVFMGVYRMLISADIPKQLGRYVTFTKKTDTNDLCRDLMANSFVTDTLIYSKTTY